MITSANKSHRFIKYSVNFHFKSFLTLLQSNWMFLFLKNTMPSWNGPDSVCSWMLRGNSRECTITVVLPWFVFQLQSICSSLLRQRIQGFPVVKSILSLKQLCASKDLNLFKLSGMPRTPWRSSEFPDRT